MLLRDADAVLAVEPDRAALVQAPNVGVVGPCSPEAETAFEVRAFMRQGRWR